MSDDYRQSVSHVTIITTVVLSMSFFVAGVTIAAVCFYFKFKTSSNLYIFIFYVMRSHFSLCTPLAASSMGYVVRMKK